MHFDGRTQRALREAGLETDEIAAVSDRVADLVAADAAALRTFFAGDGPVYSDMELAHSTAETQEHPTADVDLFTHGSDLRGYLSLDGWGVPVEGGRVLTTADAGNGADPDAVGDDAGDEDRTADHGDVPTLVELTLGDTINGRVRFSRDREAV